VVIAGEHIFNVSGLDFVGFPENTLESMRAKARRYLETVSARLEGTKATTRSEVRVGNIAQNIIGFADESDARLIALSTHGYSGIRRWLFGDVARKVLQAGEAPILLVKAPAPDA